nr:MAG: internal scaffolding protein [Microviridae sp.]
MVLESPTQQHFANEVNIHEIIKRSERTGMLPGIAGGAITMSQTKPIFGDFSIITDYQSALEQMAVSEEAFMSLPPETRIRFNNNPANLLDFVADVNNKDEAIKLGLIDSPVKAPEPVINNLNPVPAAPKAQ